MQSFIAIDFETANHRPDSACAIGVVKVQNNQVVAKDYRLIRPPQSYFTFTHIHGIKWADVADKPTFKDIWQALAPITSSSSVFVAHNASFDQRVLHACCAAYRLPRPAHRFVCTVQLARQVWKIFPTTLPDVCRKLNIAVKHHNAGSDAEACAQIVCRAYQNRR